VCTTQSSIMCILGGFLVSGRAACFVIFAHTAL
jgi:hypothetical protein